MSNETTASNENSNDDVAKKEVPAPDVWPKIVKLDHPVEFGKETITSLTFRRGRAGDMEGISIRSGEVTADALMTVAARMAGVSPKVIKSLDADDVGAVTEIALDFFERFLTAGKKQPR